MAQQVVIDINASTRQFESALDELTAKVKSTAAQMDKAFSVSGNAEKSIKNTSNAVSGLHEALKDISIVAAGNMLAKGFESAAGKIKKIGDEIYRTTEYMQGLEMSMKSIVAADSIKTGKYQDYNEAVKHAEKDTEELMAWFKKLSLVSPYEYTDVIEAFKSNANMGQSVETAKKTTKAILELGSGLGMAKAQMKGFSMALAQTGATEKITATDLRQFANNGFGMDKINDIFGRISQKYDIVINDHNDFNNAVKSGKITIEAFFDALGEYADQNYGGAVEAMASTIGGLKSSLSDIKTNAINDLFLETSKTISKTLKPYIEYLMELLTSGNFTEWGKGINNWVQGIITPFQKIGEAMENGHLMTAMAQIKDFFTGKSLNLGAVKSIMQTMMGEGYNDAWIDKIWKFKDVYEWIIAHKGTIIDTFKGIGIAVSGALSVSLITRFAAAIGGILASPVTWLIAAGAAIGIAWNNNFLGIQDRIKSVIEYVQELYGLFKEGGLSAVWQKLSTDATRALKDLSSKYTAYRDKLIEVFQQEGLTGVFKTIGTDIGNWLWTQADEFIKHNEESLQKIKTGLLTVVENIFGKDVAESLSNAITDVENYISSLNKTFQEEGLSGVWDKLKTDANTALDEIGNYIEAHRNEWIENAGTVTLDIIEFLFGKDAATAVEEFCSKIDTTLAPIIEQINKIGGILSDTAEESIRGSVAALQQNFSELAEVFDRGVWSEFLSNMAKLAGVLAVILAIISDLAIGSIDNIVGSISRNIVDLFTTLQSTADWMNNFVKLLSSGDDIEKGWQAAVNMQDATDRIVDSIAIGIRGILINVADIIMGFVFDIEDWFASNHMFGYTTESVAAHRKSWAGMKTAETVYASDSRKYGTKNVADAQAIHSLKEEFGDTLSILDYILAYQEAEGSEKIDDKVLDYYLEHYADEIDQRAKTDIEFYKMYGGIARQVNAIEDENGKRIQYLDADELKNASKYVLKDFVSFYSGGDDLSRLSLLWTEEDQKRASEKGYVPNFDDFRKITGYYLPDEAEERLYKAATVKLEKYNKTFMTDWASMMYNKDTTLAEQIDYINESRRVSGNSALTNEEIKALQYEYEYQTQYSDRYSRQEYYAEKDNYYGQLTDVVENFGSIISTTETEVKELGETASETSKATEKAAEATSEATETVTTSSQETAKEWKGTAERAGEYKEAIDEIMATEYEVAETEKELIEEEKKERQDFYSDTVKHVNPPSFETSPSPVTISVELGDTTSAKKYRYTREETANPEFRTARETSDWITEQYRTYMDDYIPQISELLYQSIKEEADKYENKEAWESSDVYQKIAKYWEYTLGAIDPAKGWSEEGYARAIGGGLNMMNLWDFLPKDKITEILNSNGDVLDLDLLTALVDAINKGISDIGVQIQELPSELETTATEATPPKPDWNEYGRFLTSEADRYYDQYKTAIRTQMVENGYFGTGEDYDPNKFAKAESAKVGSKEWKEYNDYYQKALQDLLDEEDENKKIKAFDTTKYETLDTLIHERLNELRLDIGTTMDSFSTVTAENFNDALSFMKEGELWQDFAERVAWGGDLDPQATFTELFMILEKLSSDPEWVKDFKDDTFLELDKLKTDEEKLELITKLVAALDGTIDHLNSDNAEGLKRIESVLKEHSGEGTGLTKGQSMLKYTAEKWTKATTEEDKLYWQDMMQAVIFSGFYDHNDDTFSGWMNTGKGPGITAVDLINAGVGSSIWNEMWEILGNGLFMSDAGFEENFNAIRKQRGIQEERKRNMENYPENLINGLSETPPETKKKDKGLLSVLLGEDFDVSELFTEGLDGLADLLSAENIAKLQDLFNLDITEDKAKAFHKMATSLSTLGTAMQTLTTVLEGDKLKNLKEGLEGLAGLAVTDGWDAYVDTWGKLGTNVNIVSTALPEIDKNKDLLQFKDFEGNDGFLSFWESLASHVTAVAKGLSDIQATMEQVTELFKAENENQSSAVSGGGGGGVSIEMPSLIEMLLGDGKVEDLKNIADPYKILGDAMSNMADCITVLQSKDIDINSMITAPNQTLIQAFEQLATAMERIKATMTGGSESGLDVNIPGGVKGSLGEGVSSGGRRRVSKADELIEKLTGGGEGIDGSIFDGLELIDDWKSSLIDENDEGLGFSLDGLMEIDPETVETWATFLPTLENIVGEVTTLRDILIGTEDMEGLGKEFTLAKLFPPMDTATTEAWLAFMEPLGQVIGAMTTLRDLLIGTEDMEGLGKEFTLAQLFPTMDSGVIESWTTFMEPLNQIIGSMTSLRDVLIGTEDMEGLGKDFNLGNLFPLMDNQAIESWVTFLEPLNAVTTAIGKIRTALLGEEGMAGLGADFTLDKLFPTMEMETIESWSMFSEIIGSIAWSIGQMMAVLTGGMVDFEERTYQLGDDVAGEGLAKAFTDIGEAVAACAPNIEAGNEVFSILEQYMELINTNTEQICDMWMNTFPIAVGVFIVAAALGAGAAQALGSAAASAATKWWDLAAAIRAAIQALLEWNALNGGGTEVPGGGENPSSGTGNKPKGSIGDKTTTGTGNKPGKFHAGGGVIPSGSFAIVGEHGPEVIKTGDSAMRVFTNKTLMDEIASTKHALNMLSNSAEYFAYNRIIRGSEGNSSSTDNSQHFTNNFEGAIITEEGLRERIEDVVGETIRKEIRLAS